MIERLLLYSAIVVAAFLMMHFATLRHRDNALIWIVVLGISLRLLVGYLNIQYGPFPGAEIDAVSYEETAGRISQDFLRTGDYEWQRGRYGYSSLIGLAYVVGGRDPFLPTAINALFILHLLSMLYRTGLILGSRKTARFAAGVAALYPTTVFYTSVPLREAPLMWGMGMWLLGTLLYLRGRGRPFSFRSVLGTLFAVWFHTAFFVLFLLTPLFIWLKGLMANGSRPSKGSNSIRVVMVGLALGVGVLLFVKFAGGLEKVPDDPTQVANLEYLNQIRSYKASYGTGYLGFAPSSWPVFVATLPLLMVRFLSSPTVLDVARNPSLDEAIKMVDGLVLLVCVPGAFSGCRTAWRQGKKIEVALVATTLLVLLLVFSVGTANVGIAIRHRAKFVWLFAVMVSFRWWRPSRTAVEDPIPKTASLVSERNEVKGAHPLGSFLGG